MSISPITDIFKKEFQLVSTAEAGAEPSIRKMIVYWYRQAFDQAEAEALADSLIQKAVRSVGGLS